MADASQSQISQDKGIQKKMKRKERTVLLTARSDIVQNQTANSLRKNNHKIANFNTLQWNASGLSQAKKNNIQIQLDKYDIDVFFITESNISEQNQIYYKFKNYKTCLLYTSRCV